MTTIPENEGLTQSQCIECGCDLTDRPESGRCPRCRRSYDKAATLLLPAAGPGGGQLLAATVIWLSVLGAVIGLGQNWLAAVAGVAMIVHLACLHRRGAGGPRRLAATNDGVYLLFGDHRPELKRWHLFEEARVEPVEHVAILPEHSAAQRWKLTLVNGYKPSISSYLHHRGTDELIYTPTVEFEFHATTDEADRVHHTCQQRIGQAVASFKILQLKSMGEIPPDPDLLLHLTQCPNCQAALDDASPSQRCGQCDFLYKPDMFLVRGVTPRCAHGITSVIVILAVITFCFFLAKLTSYGVASASVGAALAGFSMWRAAVSGKAGPCRLLVSDGGVEVVRRNDPPAFLPYRDIGTMRIVCTETGRIRLAIWPDVKSRVQFSPWYFSWLVQPAGPAIIDMIIRDEDRRSGEMICAEIERRWRQHVGVLHKDDPRAVSIAP